MPPAALAPVTEALLATSPPAGLQIKATDIAAGMVQLYNATSAARKWPYTATAMDAQKLDFADKTFSHTFLSFGLPIIDDPVRAAKEMYRTLRPGGTAVTAFWLQIPQGECAQETRCAVYGPDARLAVQPKPEHKDRDYLRSLLVQGGFRFQDVQLHEKSAFLPVRSLDEFALAIWSALGVPPGGWTQHDEDTWDAAVAKYKELLQKRSGFRVDGQGNITLEAIAQVAIVRKTRE
ncbi:Cytochrome P450 monooxygenase [Apiospora rasikravindrae]|uniref:Cytochrome P450 monooxygenase n=1 Tax=Apiospora rasikravindrae TaxID=990691 RepID=A0ABR1U899_9PEZI